VRTDRGFDRFITLLDAVVAIAITLLVLPLVEVLGGVHAPADAAAVFVHYSSRFWAFLLSFAVIARLWMAHHRLVERVGGYDDAFILVNLGWALTIVFLPFATQLTAEYSAHDRIAVAVYLGTMTVSSVCLTAMGLLVWRRPQLRREGTQQGDAVPRVLLVNTAAFVVALALGTALPRVNYYALLLLFLTGPVDRVFARRAARKALDPQVGAG
jgi:uncharacterized membrane protein